MGTLYIPLTHGKVALIDEEDAQLILSLNWRAFRAYDRWYAMKRGGADDGLRMHRLIMDAKPGELVDHKNGDGLDNRRSNLRIATQQQNNINKRHLPSTNRSGFIGVSQSSNRASVRWRAQIVVNRKQINLGAFGSPEEAALAYDAAARIHFGEFARLNFPRPGERGIRSDDAA